MTTKENENRYCNGIINCKYDYDGECMFFYNGSGNKNDMPCLQQSEKYISEFRAWRAKKYGADMRGGRK